MLIYGLKQLANCRWVELEKEVCGWSLRRSHTSECLPTLVWGAGGERGKEREGGGGEV